MSVPEENSNSKEIISKKLDSNDIEITSFIADVTEVKLNDDDHSGTQQNIEILCSKDTVDNSTQTVLFYTDKECNTSTTNKNELTMNDYIPINGPIYVPRNSVNAHGQIMLSTSLHMGVDYIPAKENLQNQNHTQLAVNNITDVSNLGKNANATTQDKITLEDKSNVSNVNTSMDDNIKSCRNQALSKSNLSISNYTLNPEPDLYKFYINKQNLCRLLDSDYDLTPERDSNFDRYNHLLNETSTNVAPDVNLSERERNPNLLITEHYAIGRPSNSQNENCLTTSQSNEDVKNNLTTSIKSSVSLDDYEVDSKSEGEIQKVTNKKSS